MISRPARSWLIFAGCAAAIVLALCWVTHEVSSLARSEASARHEARVQEAMRLALWRIDSSFAPIVAQEAVRAPSDYPPPTGGPEIPSAFPPFKLYFAADGDGHASTPAIVPFLAALHPQNQDRKQKRGAGEKEEQALMIVPAPGDAKSTVPALEGRAEGKDDDQAGSRPAERLALLMDSEEDEAPPPARSVPVQSLSNDAAPASNVLPQVGQVERSKDEFQSRARMTEQVKDTLKAQVFYSNAWNAKNNPTAGFTVSPSAADVTTSALTPRWLPGNELFLVRTLTDRATKATTTQGIWCDWPALEAWLLDKAKDIFPAARLEPVTHTPAVDDGSLMASVPARFVPGRVEHAAAASRASMIVIVAAWAAAIVAIASVGGVLRAAVSLGERRGRFVSAVTHELRTPLTTFRMYAQMLADGMVAKDAQPEYLATLKDESERLARVVESVLLYSRLEEGRGGAHREVMRCDALLERVLPVARKRAHDGGLLPEITAVISEEGRVEVDAQAVEQIVLNLVDNACKYAQPADPRLEISCRMNGRMLEIACRDFGPGIPADEAESVFLPFRRGARDVAGTTAGVGLGLALARGLAHALGGDLVLDRCQPGARFTLKIPRI